MRLLLFVTCFFFYCTIVVSQNNNEIGNWFMYNGSHKITEKWAIKSMAHFRYYKFAEDFQQEIYRLGANYTLHKKLNFTLGYSYVTTDFISGKGNNTVFENRIYEDINYSNVINKFKLSHRFRFEHRFIRANSVNSDSHWFRYDLNGKYPISEKWIIYAFNEIFFNMDKSKRFVQNWTGFGFLHQLNSSLKLNLGYQQIKLPNQIQKRILIGIIVNTNHLKK